MQRRPNGADSLQLSVDSALKHRSATHPPACKTLGAIRFVGTDGGRQRAMVPGNQLMQRFHTASRARTAATSTVIATSAWIEDGADTRIRTGDLPLTRRLLYQLSYAGEGRRVARRCAF
ncbi:hypothetical protein XAP412_730020 [Xanthomonas phaseoli pv. phaseoli]|uniref:Uncharacterized protein n=1 Tax=Xanthomonas campestris pv. phaseoli TaxID=317013 RepID=A0AB38E3W6_XANCH|nr:hypothetical protein XAP412_730020 [Xanthomonas phaseoli pv. phaseoli]SON92199.1 hypothetical protein XAP7430_730020 [Xanthomonas phaseoli pv. phaseoli]